MKKFNNKYGNLNYTEFFNELQSSMSNSNEERIFRSILHTKKFISLPKANLYLMNKHLVSFNPFNKELEKEILRLRNSVRAAISTH